MSSTDASKCACFWDVKLDGSLAEMPTGWYLCKWQSFDNIGVPLFIAGGRITDEPRNLEAAREHAENGGLFYRVFRMRDPMEVDQLTSRFAFLTGSRCYGSPNASSDCDIVVYCDDPAVKDLLMAISDHGETAIPYTTRGYSVKFGKLNLVVFNDLRDYSGWLTATRHMHERCKATGKTFNREEAARIIDDCVEQEWEKCRKSF